MLEDLTTHQGVVKMSNTKASLIAKVREAYSHNAFVVTIWHVPRPVPGCTHAYKYRLAYVVSKAITAISSTVKRLMNLLPSGSFIQIS